MSKYMMGQSNHTIDPKGRLIVPIRLREALGMSFVLCYGQDHNLKVYPMDVWENFTQELESLPSSNQKVRKYKHFFLGSAAICEPDGQFRIVIPQELRKYAGIEKELVIVGDGTTAEIWSKEGWEAYNSPESMDIDELSEFISENYNF